MKITSLRKQTLSMLLRPAVLTLAFSFATAYSASAVAISGDISKITFDPVQKLYNVTGDIFIPAGAQVQIPAGTVLLFDAKTTFRIDGICSAEGTAQKPIVFTSVNDTFSPVKSAAPTIFDWNGIVISQSATHVVLHYVTIKYAEHPLESTSPDLQLRNCLRLKTSDDFFLLNGTARQVEAAVPFFDPQPLSPTPQPDPNNLGENTQPPSVSPASPIPPEKKSSWWRQMPLRLTLLGTGAASLLAAGGCAIGYFAYYDIAKKENTTSLSIPMPTTEKEFSLVQTADKRSKNAFHDSEQCRRAATISGIIGTVVLAGFGLTFYF